ncbi:MAG: hypothetical protein ACXAB4_08325 [Candidatus Hodarchaeales archaeon]
MNNERTISYWDTILETIKMVQVLKQHEEDPSQYSKARGAH